MPDCRQIPPINRIHSVFVLTATSDATGRAGAAHAGAAEGRGRRAASTLAGNESPVSAGRAVFAGAAEKVENRCLPRASRARLASRRGWCSRRRLRGENRECNPTKPRNPRVCSTSLS